MLPQSAMTEWKHKVLCFLPWLVASCHAASEGLACPAHPGHGLGPCVCRRPGDCFTEMTTALRLPSGCCDPGLVCCPDTGVSKQKCLEYSRLVRVWGEAYCPALALPLIVGGDEAAPGQVPHMALLGYGPFQEAAQWLCGGALVSERWVLSAAHCIHGPMGSVRWVRLGAWFDGDPGEDAAQELSVSLGIVHPAYHPPARYNDIGLLRLLDAPTLGPSVRPACLHGEFAIPGTKAQACGYGRVTFDAESSGDALRCVWIPFMPRVDCARYYRDEMASATLPRGLPRSLLCASDTKGGKDTCQGDSGGPLQVQAEEPFCTYSLVGVTAFGKFCGFPNSAGVYMRVSHYLPWIESIVWPREVQAARATRGFLPDSPPDSLTDPVREGPEPEIWLVIEEEIGSDSLWGKAGNAMTTEERLLAGNFSSADSAIPK